LTELFFSFFFVIKLDEWNFFLVKIIEKNSDEWHIFLIRNVIAGLMLTLRGYTG